VVRAFALAIALLAPAALAQASIEGVGRITVVAGYRWVPNWYFAERAAAANVPFERPSVGGPAATVSFGYGATSVIELAVDGFFAWERFTLAGLRPFDSFVYGGALGPRFTRGDVFFKGFMPYVSVQGGPLFASVQSPSLAANPERALGALFVAGGFNLRIAERWAITFDVRWVYARSVVPEISGLNVGGVVFSLGLTTFFPATPPGPLDVPGFSSPSNL
jgi:hypothetical protein